MRLWGLPGLPSCSCAIVVIWRCCASSWDEQAPARLENLNEFLSVTQQFEKESSGADLGAFLEHVALISDVDNYDREANVVNLMTLHAAKGLEFPVVFMCGMEDGIFPHSRALWEPGQIEGAAPGLRGNDSGSGAPLPDLCARADHLWHHRPKPRFAVHQERLTRA